MALVNYGSSDEEGSIIGNAVDLNISNHSSNTNTNGFIHSSEPNGNEDAPSARLPGERLVGPVFGPAVAEPPEELSIVGNDQDMTPLSPYSSNRALLRQLTLPTMPNYDIPPSPQASPSGGTNSRFKHFLELKQRGVHFNDKLAKSSALKNPSLMQKLMDFSDIDEIGQYATALPKDLWSPGSFPQETYKEGLARNQQKILKRKEDEKIRGHRDSVDFVAASSSTDSLIRGGKSAAERILAGLDRAHSSSPQVQGTKRKSRFDS